MESWTKACGSLTISFDPYPFGSFGVSLGTALKGQTYQTFAQRGLGATQVKRAVTACFWSLLVSPYFAQYPWMDKIRSHHFETMGSHFLLVFTGESSETRVS